MYLAYISPGPCPCLNKDFRYFPLGVYLYISLKSRYRFPWTSSDNRTFLVSGIKGWSDNRMYSMLSTKSDNSCGVSEYSTSVKSIFWGDKVIVSSTVTVEAELALFLQEQVIMDYIILIYRKCAFIFVSFKIFINTTGVKSPVMI